MILLGLKKIVLAALLVISSSQLFAAHDACIQNKKVFPSLDSVFNSGQFRVYYASDPNSLDFLSHRQDLNKNAIPDLVEDIVIQANSTYEVLKYLNFVSPLDSDRYKDKAIFIDIHVVNMKGNGSAGENAITYINQKNKNNACALTITIRNTIDFPGHYWTIVSHELLHLYQYGYTQFKGGWFLEGMVNSIERLLKKGSQGGLSGGTTILPSTQTELEERVYRLAYNELWARLAVLSDQAHGKLALPQELFNRTYINGSKVFRDDQFKGYLFFRQVLENLQQEADNLSKKRNWDKYHWKESDQISETNRTYMLRAIQTAMMTFEMNKTQEERDFLNLN